MNRADRYVEKKFGKKRLRELKNECSAAEINSAEQYVLHMSKPEIESVKDDEEAPNYFRSLCNSSVTDFSVGRTTTVDRLRDRQYGSVTQDVNVSGEVGFMSILRENGIIDEEGNLTEGE